MSKRTYTLNIKEIGEMIGSYMRAKYPELSELPEDTDITIRFSNRKDELTVEFEL